jgi:hypothetical protein
MNETKIVLALGVFSGVGMLAWAASNSAAQDIQPRYREIGRSIQHHRHLSGHMTMAVDTRTIKAVKAGIGAKDIPVLVQMMGDKDYGVASAASGLLVTLGKDALPALTQAEQSKNASIATQARDAVQSMRNCYDEALRSSMNGDACPPDWSGSRPAGSPAR